MWQKIIKISLYLFIAILGVKIVRVTKALWRFIRMVRQPLMTTQIGLTQTMTTSIQFFFLKLFWKHFQYCLFFDARYYCGLIILFDLSISRRCTPLTFLLFLGLVPNFFLFIEKVPSFSHFKFVILSLWSFLGFSSHFFFSLYRKSSQFFSL